MTRRPRLTISSQLRFSHEHGCGAVGDGTAAKALADCLTRAGQQAAGAVALATERAPAAPPTSLLRWTTRSHVVGSVRLLHPRGVPGVARGQDRHAVAQGRLRPALGRAKQSRARRRVVLAEPQARDAQQAAIAAPSRQARRSNSPRFRHRAAAPAQEESSRVRRADARFATHSVVFHGRGGRLHRPDDPQAHPREADVTRRTTASIGHRTAGSRGKEWRISSEPVPLRRDRFQSRPG